jgi:hypothetical protein
MPGEGFLQKQRRVFYKRWQRKRRGFYRRAAKGSEELMAEKIFYRR